MGIQVTFEVPEAVFAQVSQIAVSTQRAVDDVLKELVVDSMPPIYDVAHQVDEDDTIEVEVAAFEAMHAALWQKYPKQFVAIHQGLVVDHDQDEWALIERINQHYSKAIVLIREVKSALPGEFIFRSPRVERHR